MLPSNPINFNPPAEITSALLLALTDPALSFNQLAQVCGTTPEALALWLHRPDIRAQIESVDRITTWRTRLIAASHLQAVPPALIKILHNFLRTSDSEDASQLTPYSETPPTTTPSGPAPAPELDYRKQLLALRHAETARKSAALLVALTRARPTAGPDLAPAQPAAAAPEASAPAATSNTQPPKSDIPLEDLLAQLAPHLASIASDLGIDPNQPLAAPDPEPPPSEPESEPRPRDHTNIDPSPRAPSRPGESHRGPPSRTLRTPELATAAAHEHWP
jgi:hypothetical protein